MATEITKTVGEVALENSAAPAILESLGIDYCCGGHLSFAEACRKAGRQPEDVAEQLALAAAKSTERKEQSTDWKTQPLLELIGHIKATHHAFVRSESPRLLTLGEKVAAKHTGHAELRGVKEVFGELAQELQSHLMKEEQILFPYIERLEAANRQQVAPGPSCFGTIENPIRMMMLEHDSAGNALRELRRLTNDYRLPADACMSYRSLFQGLLEFEADLHRHIHLENNILFPRAIELERGR